MDDEAALEEMKSRYTMDWIMINYSDEEVQLDGVFTVEDLKVIIRLKEKA